MFSGRLPDHLLHSGTVLDEAAAFEALVQNKEPLKSIFDRLRAEKTLLDQHTERDPYGRLGVPRTPRSVRVVDHVW